MTKDTKIDIEMTQQEITDNLRKLRAFNTRNGMDFDFQDSIVSNTKILIAAVGVSDPVTVSIYPVSHESYPLSFRPIDLEYLDWMVSRK